MDGVRIKPGSALASGASAQDAARTSTFARIIRPIAKRLEPLHWYADRYDSSPFVRMVYEDGGEERLDRALIELPEQAESGNGRSGLLFGPGTLPALASYMADDWMDLIGIDARGHDPLAVASRLYRLGSGAADRDSYHAHIERHAALYFHNHDGWWWEVCCPDAAVLDEVERHVAAHPLFQTERTTLADKAARDAAR